MWKGWGRGETCVITGCASASSPQEHDFKPNFLHRVPSKVSLGFLLGCFLLVGPYCCTAAAVPRYVVHYCPAYKYQSAYTTVYLLGTSPFWLHDRFYDSPISCQRTPVGTSPLPVRGTGSQRPAANQMSIPECMGVRCTRADTYNTCLVRTLGYNTVRTRSMLESIAVMMPDHQEPRTVVHDHSTELWKACPVKEEEVSGTRDPECSRQSGGKTLSAPWTSCMSRVSGLLESSAQRPSWTCPSTRLILTWLRDFD